MPRSSVTPDPGRRGRVSSVLLGPLLRVVAGLILGRQPVPSGGQPLTHLPDRPLTGTGEDQQRRPPVAGAPVAADAH